MAVNRIITGTQGSGKSHHLKSLSGVYLDCGQPQKDLLREMIDLLGGEWTTKDQLPELITNACELCRSTNKTLLFDNIDRVSERCLTQMIVPCVLACSSGVIATATNQTTTQQKRIEAITHIFKIEQIKPISDDVAREIVLSIMPNAKGTTVRHIVRSAAGNPGAVVAFSTRIHRGDDRRNIRTNQPYISLNWLLLLVVFVLVYLWRVRAGSDDRLMFAVLVAGSVIVRMLFTRSFRKLF